jgi:hypothetical protein
MISYLTSAVAMKATDPDTEAARVMVLPAVVSHESVWSAEEPFAADRQYMSQERTP